MITPLLLSLAPPCPPSLPKPAPRVLVNELQVDPVGPDAGFEWIELAILDPVPVGALDGWSLADQDGATVFDFPLGASFAPGWSVCVILGDERPGVLSADLASRRATAWFRGPTTGDLLGNDAGGLGLRDATGALVDFVAWGHGAPPTGSLWSAAVGSGAWADGDFVDLAFDAPGPVFPGATFGRDRDATDSDRAADWSGNGGADAAGATPAQRNDRRVEDVEGLIERSQELFVHALASYGSSPSQPARFSVPSSAFDLVEVVDLPGIAFEVRALHDFTVQDAVTGTVETWSGTLIARSEPCPGRCVRLAISGGVAGPSQDGLSLSWAHERSGFGGRVLADVQSSSLVLTLGGVDHPRDTVSDQRTELVAEGHQRCTIQRTETNWGNAASFDATLVLDVQDVSPSRRTVDSTMTMLHPALAAPALDAAPSSAGPTVTEVANATLDFTSPEEYTSTRSVEYYLGGDLVGTVAAGDPEVAVVQRTAGAAGDVLGSFSSVRTVPVRAADGTPLFDLEVRSDRDVTRVGGKETTWITTTYERVEPDQTVTPLGSESFHVDPPTQTTWNKGNPGATVTLYGDSSPEVSTRRMMSEAVVPFGLWALCARVAGSMAATTPATLGVGGGVGATGAAAACTAAGLTWMAFQ